MDAVYTAPGYLFRRMQQIAVSIFVEECRSFDLTPVQYAALVAIHTHPGIDATRLSAVIAFDRSTLGNVIERLESKALIERKPSREDKRVKLLYLTKSGAAVLRDIMPSVERAQLRMLQPLKPADRKTLLALLTQLVDLNNEASRVPLRAEDALEHLGKAGSGSRRQKLRCRPGLEPGPITTGSGVRHAGATAIGTTNIGGYGFLRSQGRHRVCCGYILISA
jgi:DNA-binding MarR family transcriptional regulator